MVATVGFSPDYLASLICRFAELHEFQKPNDGRFSQLMNESTVSLLKEYPDIAFAYGVNDEYR